VSEPAMQLSKAIRPLVWLAAAGGAIPVPAADADAAREEVQKALNAQVMSTPFNAGDIKKAEAYAVEAKRKNLQPVAQPPAYWLPGWTCASIASHAYYSYVAYRDCVYYHHYHGRYWR